MIKEIVVRPRTASLRVPIERDGELFGWHELEYPAVWTHHRRNEPEATWLTHPDGRRVMISVLIEADGNPWLHVSVWRANRIPSYEDLTDTKAAFVGRERKAIQVFPGEAEFVNFHPYCLHLWCRLDGDSLPDFSRANAII